MSDGFLCRMRILYTRSGICYSHSMSYRTVQKIFPTVPTIEGAGVYLKRGFGFHEVPQFDPFLLFDDFSNTEAAHYRAGFPVHPHRGMETVTYIKKGEVRHRDSLGSNGSIGAGDVQWMTAGSGIVHEEMPVVHDEGIQGFQLWVNLPQTHKMMSPRYQDIRAHEIPVVTETGKEVRVIAGVYGNAQGPVQDLMVSPTYFDVTLDAGASFSIPTDPEENFFVYVYEGSITCGDDHLTTVSGGEIALLTSGSECVVTGGVKGANFLLIGGKPLKEPIVWHGPIVMNTQDEIKTALAELQNGTFIKSGG